MGQQIIKQPDGKYCLFSSIVDSVIYYNMTKEEIVEVWTEQAKKDFENKVNEITEKLDEGEKPYYQFTMNYEDMLKTILEVHNASEMENVKSAIESE